MEKIELENLRIASPCKVSWDSMKGDDKVRYCSQCSLNVYNISGMTKSEAIKTLGIGEKLCVTFYRREDGTILNRDCPVGIKQIKSWCKLTFAIFGTFLTGSVLFHTIFKNELQDRYDRQKAFDDYSRYETGAKLQAKGKVVYAIRDVSPGWVIRADDLEEKEVEQSKIPMDALTSASLGAGRVSKYGISQGQIVSQHDVIDTSVKNYRLRLSPSDKERVIKIACKKGTTVSILVTEIVRERLYIDMYNLNIKPALGRSTESSSSF